MRALTALLAAAILLVPAAPSLAQDTATVTCKDGTTSKGGRGACSGHGGINRSAANTGSTPAASTPAPKSAAPSTTPAAPAATPSPKPAPTTSTSTGKASNKDAAGATAQCKDGTYSHSKHHTGACSHHGGVAKWLDQG